MSKVSPVSYQLAYFISGVDLSDKLKTAEQVRSSLGSFLDGSPTILPIPDDAPNEIPRIIYTSKKNDYIINISPARIDFIRNKSSDELKKINTIKEFLMIEKLVTNVVFDSLKPPVYRLGVILNFKINLGLKAIKYIQDNYKKTKSNPYQLEFNQQIKGNIENMKTNQWVRLTARDYEVKGEDKENLSVMVDINTILEEKYKVDKKTASIFFSKSFSLAIEEVTSL